MSEVNPETAEFVLERKFAAPPEKVWRAWTEPELLARWYKPNASCATAVLHCDLRPGGTLLYEMRFGEAPPHIELWEFTGVDAPSRLQWKQMLSDPDGNVIENARMPEWPRALMTTIELEPHPEGTLQRMTWTPHEATEAELACFVAMAAKMGGMGWASAFDNLGELVPGL